VALLEAVFDFAAGETRKEPFLRLFQFLDGEGMNDPLLDEKGLNSLAGGSDPLRSFSIGCTVQGPRFTAQDRSRRTILFLALCRAP